MEIFGKNAIDLALKTNQTFNKVWIDSKKYPSLFQEFKKRKIPVYEFDYYKGNSSNTQKIVASINEFQYTEINEMLESAFSKKENPVLVILDKITDPQNLGSIIRNSVAFEIDGIILPKFNQAPINGTAIKASAGTAFLQKICLVSSLNTIVQNLKKKDFWIVSTQMKGNFTLKELENYNKPIVIILGSEGDGVSPTLLSKSDLLLSIPINKEVESLNVSSTSSIIFHCLYKK